MMSNHSTIYRINKISRIESENVNNVDRELANLDYNFKYTPAILVINGNKNIIDNDNLFKKEGFDVCYNYKGKKYNKHEYKSCGKALAYLRPSNVGSHSRTSSEKTNLSGYDTKAAKASNVDHGHKIAYALTYNLIKVHGHGFCAYKWSHKDNPNSKGDSDDPYNEFSQTSFCNRELQHPFEQMISKWLVGNTCHHKGVADHVIYVVHPIFRQNENMARGVHLQAKAFCSNGQMVSKNDKQGYQFNVYLFNIQPGYRINYKNGKFKKIKDSMP